MITELDSLIQALCDPENQPHQFVGDYDGLKKAIEKATKEEV